MYLKIGSRIRPFNEADVGITYEPRFDVQRKMVAVSEVWNISGRVVLQTNATQTRMTQALMLLQQDFEQYRPDLVFLEDNGVTESFFKLKANELLEGPTLIGASFPDDPSNVYETGTAYTATMMGVRPIGTSNAILSFTETISCPESGGEIRGYVGGAINLPELQTFKQHQYFHFYQTGSAVGLYGYPVPPPPIWPAYLLKRMIPTRTAPRIQGPVKQEFEVSWQYEFGSPFELIGAPHEVI